MGKSKTVRVAIVNKIPLAIDTHDRYFDEKYLPWKCTEIKNRLTSAMVEGGGVCTGLC